MSDKQGLTPYSIFKIIVFIFSFAAAVAAIYFAASKFNSNPQTNETLIPPKIDSNPYIVLGNPNASIKIVEFFDPACPYSYMYFNNTFPKIYENYVKTNKIGYIIRAFPLEAIHPHAFDATRYLYCLYAYTDFDNFTLARRILYIKRKNWMLASGFNLTKSLVNSVIFDEYTFNNIARCYEYNESSFYVYNDYSIGKIYGVMGTPSIVIVADNTSLTDEEKLEIEQHFSKLYKTPKYAIKKDPYGRYLIPIIGALPYEEFDYVLSRLIS